METSPVLCRGSTHADISPSRPRRTLLPLWPSGGAPVAYRTGDYVTLPSWHAEPVEAATSGVAWGKKEFHSEVAGQGTSGGEQLVPPGPFGVQGQRAISGHA